MPVSIATPKGPFATSQVAHRALWQRISKALSNDDLFAVVAFACLGLLVSLVLLQTAPLSSEMATFLSQVS